MALFGTVRIPKNKFPAGQQFSTMAASIAAQSHCFADLFCKCMIIQHHTRSYNIIHYHTCVQKPLEAPSRPSLVNDPTMQELDHSRARANDLQKTQAEQLAEITRISKELEILSLLVSLWLWCIIGCSSESMKELPLFFQFPLRLMHLSPDRINFWQADLLIFSTLWWWCFVSLLQERDECSEVSPMHALEEKYKAKMSQLAKDSQVVSSFKWEHCNIAIGRSMALLGTFRIKRNRCVLLASNIQQW